MSREPRVTGIVAEHLRALGSGPRAAGSAAEHEARMYAASVLQALGFDVREEAFSYSAFPGRYATPVAGVVLGAAVVVAGALALRGEPVAAAVVLTVATVAVAIFARWLLAHGVLDAPWLRAESVNLVATRTAEPVVWLVAHLDSKSQPVPSALRVAGVVTLALGVAVAVVAVALTLAGVPVRTLWWAAIAAGVVGALPVGASVVGNASDGAVDNASGVAAVLAAAALLRPDVPVGVLLPSAEEMGLAGARAFARMHAPSMALNCDGVDDDGALVIMYNSLLPLDVVRALQRPSPDARPRRMPLGLLTDSTALAAAGWRAVTVSHGSVKTLRRVHTVNDSLANLRGTSIDRVATTLARAAEALAT